MSLSRNEQSRSSSEPRIEKEPIEVTKEVLRKVIITKEECYDKTGFGFSTVKKWWILAVIFIVQVSMNFNAGVYGNAVKGMQDQFHMSTPVARCGQMIFLIAYGFGSELWAPWSEELGRKPILQLSLFLVNLFQIPCALAPNFGTILAGRALGGLSSAGGSVTLGMVADMWEADDQQYAVAFVVFSSVGGSVVGPIVGGFVQESYLSWRWIFWLQLIFGVAVQALHALTVPETRVTIMMGKEAKRRRKAGEENIWGPNEVKTWGEMFSMRQMLRVWYRPFHMFVTEPIVLFLSLFSGFSDALIFTFLESYHLVYAQWGFGAIGVGLAFVPILIGYLIGYGSFIPFITRDRHRRSLRPESVQPESRLYWLLYTAPLLSGGLFGFAWTSTGPPIPWIGKMIFAACIGIANYCIYMVTIDYMVAAYGPYAVSFQFYLSFEDRD